jgi:mRNA interferase MazF
MAYQRGDVVLIPFPYSDLSAAKTRPALIVSIDSFNASGEFLALYLTSQASTQPAGSDYLLQDWRAAGLLKPTATKCRIAVLRDSLVQHKVGTVSQRDMQEIESRLRAVLGL